MSGRPLDQARRIVAALVDSLGEEDRLEMIAFSNAPRRWQAEPVQATEAARRSALEWLRKLQASGGTEMRTALVEALRPLREDAQRQVVLVTDGEIGFETEVVGEAFEAAWVSRQLEAALDPEGLSSTGRAVLGRITGEGRAT
jgi:Ca-activated chloride channel family protein